MLKCVCTIQTSKKMFCILCRAERVLFLQYFLNKFPSSMETTGRGMLISFIHLKTSSLRVCLSLSGVS